MKIDIKAGFTRTIAHTAIVTSGQPIANGTQAAIANGAYIADESGEYDISGVKKFDKTAALVLAQGVKCDWDIATAKVVATTLGDFELGIVDEPAAGADDSVNVLVNGLPMAFV